MKCNKCNNHISGSISQVVVIEAGEISGKSRLVGELSIPAAAEHEYYTGEYNVIPHTYSPIVLDTKGKLMYGDVTVEKVPRWDTSNETGVTVYIGSEV